MQILVFMHSLVYLLNCLQSNSGVKFSILFRDYIYYYYKGICTGFFNQYKMYNSMSYF